jgi:hypothetical protein
MKTLVVSAAVMLSSFLASTSAQATLVSEWTFENPATTQNSNIAYTGLREANSGPTSATFKCGITASISTNCYVFAYGGNSSATERAFQTNDTPLGWSTGNTVGLGRQGLTDESNGPLLSFNYYMSFDQVIYDLQASLIDYRSIFGTAVLELFANANFGGGVVGSASLTGSLSNPNGVVSQLFASSPTGAQSAAIRFTGLPDLGTALDNVRVSVPEPASMAMLSLGGLMIAAGRRKRRTIAAQ